jgi:diketogulonate reductase-like aldo/keto reductase
MMMLRAYNHVPIPSFMYGTAWKKEATAQLAELGVVSGFRAAMEGLYHSGKTKMIGISNVTAGQLAKLCEQANVNPWLCRTGVLPRSGGTKR